MQSRPVIVGWVARKRAIQAIIFFNYQSFANSHWPGLFSNRRFAAYQAMWCGNALHEYIDVTTRGATPAVKILEVATVWGKIAEGILTGITIGGGLMRLLGRKGGTLARDGGAPWQLAGGGQRQLPAAGQTSTTPVSGKASVSTKGYSTAGPKTLGSNAASVAPKAAAPITSGAVNTPMIKAAKHLRQQAGLEPLVDMWADPHFLQEHAQLVTAKKSFLPGSKPIPRRPSMPSVRHTIASRPGSGVN
jgi:hypothetical protein